MTDYIGIRLTLDANMGCKKQDYIGICPIFLFRFYPYVDSTAGGGM